jgi:UDP-N-acetylglucosamine/UDP-N-acetylgalactosamine diphosphorylase
VVSGGASNSADRHGGAAGEADRGADRESNRLDRLAARGVRVVDPRQTWIAPEVDLERIAPECVLHPGTRLAGSRTLLSAGSEVGTEGPATLVDTVLGEGARVASGYAEGAVLLAGASAGANAHLRPGTLMEEQASTAHAVGLKQTILLSFVTLGSLINFCDCLMAGGTSRQDHSEVGSGFIHFNFTPWGRKGDKATPSLVGDAVRGVFLREPRIFLGGSGGLVGPARIGFGSVTAAGQVHRGDVADGRLSATPLRAVNRPVDMGRLDAVEPRATRNVEYLAQLAALRAWYGAARGPRARSDFERRVLEAAVEAIDLCWRDRVKQLSSFLEERGEPAFAPDRPEPTTAFPIEVAPGGPDHVAWVQALADEQVERARGWLEAVAESVRALRPTA